MMGKEYTCKGNGIKREKIFDICDIWISIDLYLIINCVVRASCAMPRSRANGMPEKLR